MRFASPSPLRQAVDSLRDALLLGWIRDAVDAYLEAAALVGHAGDTGRLRGTPVLPLHMQRLAPAYDELLARHAARIGEGRQLVLPWDDHAAQLQREWIALASGFVCGPGRVPVQRQVLQASFGLPGPVDPQTASMLLVAAAAEFAEAA